MGARQQGVVIGKVSYLKPIVGLAVVSGVDDALNLPGSMWIGEYPAGGPAMEEDAPVVVSPPAVRLVVGEFTPDGYVERVAAEFQLIGIRLYVSDTGPERLLMTPVVDTDQKVAWEVRPDGQAAEDMPYYEGFGGTVDVPPLDQWFCWYPEEMNTDMVRLEIVD